MSDVVSPRDHEVHSSTSNVRQVDVDTGDGMSTREKRDSGLSSLMPVGTLGVWLLGVVIATRILTRCCAIAGVGN
jgi:hypothetical protein